MKKKLRVSSYQLPVKSTLRLRAFVPLCYAFILLFFVACIPAKVPTNLDDTPGPAVVVSDKTFENDQFSARYPDGWRVVTSEAQAPPSVIFVAPDNVATIQLMVGGLDNATFNDPKVKTDVRSVTLDGDVQITAILSAAVTTTLWDTYSAQFERVLASLKAISK
jgi:hypothetical protein